MVSNFLWCLISFPITWKKLLFYCASKIIAKYFFIALVDAIVRKETDEITNILESEDIDINR